LELQHVLLFHATLHLAGLEAARYAKEILQMQDKMIQFESV
jgi:hypothetical protein